MIDYRFIFAIYLAKGYKSINVKGLFLNKIEI